jgi:hypothetical protein
MLLGLSPDSCFSIMFLFFTNFLKGQVQCKKSGKQVMLLIIW